MLLASNPFITSTFSNIPQLVPYIMIFRCFCLAMDKSRELRIQAISILAIEALNRTLYKLEILSLNPKVITARG